MHDDHILLKNTNDLLENIRNHQQLTLDTNRQSERNYILYRLKR